MGKFELEKKALEHCSQYGIAEDDPRRGDIINAFCVGAKIEREACAKLCDHEYEGGANDGDAKWSKCGSFLADAIRMRSNAELTGASGAFAAKRPR